MKNLIAIILLFAANFISGIAQGISMIAIPWYFAQEAEMPLFGTLYLITNILAFFWVPYSGILIDKYNRKHIFLFINVVTGCFVLLLAITGHYNNYLSLIAVASVFMLTFLNYNIHYPNLYAFAQEIVPPDKYGKIASYLEIEGQTANMCAGALGALLLEGTNNGILSIFGFNWDIGIQIDPWDIWDIFLIDGITYFISLVIIAMISYVPLTSRKDEKGSLRSRLKTGIDYLKQHKMIFIFGLFSYAIFVTILMEGFFLNALYVNNHLQAGANVYAAAEIFYGLGAFSSAFIIIWISNKFSIPSAIIFLTLLTAWVFIWMTLSTSHLVFYTVGVLIGISNAGTRILRTTFLFKTVPNQIFGRVSGIFILLNISARIVLLVIFSMTFFSLSNNVIYAFYILAGFLCLSAFVLIYYYRDIVEVLNRRESNPQTKLN